MRAVRFGTASRHLTLLSTGLGALILSSGTPMAATCNGDPPCLEKLVETKVGDKHYIDVHFNGACKFDVFTLWVANRSSVRFTDPSKGNRNELCSSRPFRYGPVVAGQRYTIAINGCVRHIVGKDNCTWPPSPALSLVVDDGSGRGDSAKATACRNYATRAVAAVKFVHDNHCDPKVFSGRRWTSDFNEHLRWCMQADPRTANFEDRERTRMSNECRTGPPAGPKGGVPGITVTSRAGDTFFINGSGFPPNAPVIIRLGGPGAAISTITVVNNERLVA